MKIKPSYNFRIKKNSKLEQYLDTVLNVYPNGTTQQEFKQDNPEASWNIVATLAELGASADNFTFSRQGVSYTNVLPQTTIIEHAQEVSASAPQAKSEPIDAIRWPDVPRISDTADYSWFRKPAWYNRMAAMIDQGKNISLAGPPGIGKSSAVEFLAAERSKVLVNVPADAGLRRRDLSGSVELVNGHTQFLAAEYAMAAINGWWVKIDEVNAAEPDALMFLNSQIAPPYAVNFHGKSYPVHQDFRLFITYNAGLVGTKPLPEALKDRFFPIKLQFPNKAQLRRMLEANGMPQNYGDINDAEWTETVLEYGGRVWAQHEMGRMRYQITPRRLMDAVTLVTACDEDVFDAIEAAVINAVDSTTEARVLKEVLSTLKQETQFSRV